MTDALHFDAVDHRYTVGGVTLPHITGVLQAEGFVDFSSVNAAVLERARARGTAAHLACALYDQGRLDWRSIAGSVVENYVLAWEAFLESVPFCANPDFIERPLFHPAFRFAGTPDVGGWWDDVPTVVERKCTFEVAPATQIQTAAQALLLDAAGFKVQRRFAVQLKPDGTFTVPVEHRDPSDARVFLGALAAHVWKRRHFTKEAA